MKLQQGKVNRIFTNEHEHDTQMKTAHSVPSDNKEFCPVCGMWKRLEKSKLCTTCIDRAKGIKNAN
jgi:hypothetical protein